MRLHWDIENIKSMGHSSMIIPAILIIGRSRDFGCFIDHNSHGVISDFFLAPKINLVLHVTGTISRRMSGIFAVERKIYGR